MKLCKKVLITVGREYGSGGKNISEKLSRSLGIPIFDKNMLAMVAKKHGYSEDALAANDERLGNPFFEPYPFYGSEGGSVSDRLFIMQSELIREQANKGSAIFIGRCADDILKNFDNVVSIFVYAPMAARIQRIMRVEDISDSTAAEKIIRRIDKSRKSYYQFYTDKKWGSSEGMDLLINSNTLGIDGSVKLIEEFLKIKGFVE
ncbi:MAG: cytidylate kinase-like family protein [Lachnospiraceae bacterium]|nr:cytidylate kinase-like family protein [Lachnospiraceae bacterium]